MKDKSMWDLQSEYRELKWKLLIRTGFMLLGSTIVIFLLYHFFFFGRFADFVVNFLNHFIFNDYDMALSTYQYLIRNNMNLIFMAAIALVFLIVLWLYLNNFTRYFNEISQGINALVKEDKNDVALSPELAAMEKKINYVKHTLAQRAMESQLAEQRKNDLVMYLAHDIRTPLTSVIGYLSLLEEAPDMSVEQRARFVHITLDKAYRLEKMINEFFEITRFNLQQLGLTKEKIDLYYMLVQLLDEFSLLLSEHGNTVVLEADENLTVYGDPDKLARVFGNVLKNAAAYSSPGTEIPIHAFETENDLVISFGNEGKTIPKEKLEILFEKFYRLDEARTSKNGGVGLGLAIAKEIVTQHGGTITAESEKNQVRFIITLPRKL